MERSDMSCPQCGRESVHRPSVCISVLRVRVEEAAGEERRRIQHMVRQRLVGWDQLADALCTAMEENPSDVRGV